METWKDIDGYEGLYSASNLGRIRSNRGTKLAKFKILKVWKNKRGYGAVCLHDNNKKQRKHYVHRLVFLAFNGYDPETVNHKNGNKLDNRIKNLEPMTRTENFEHAIKVLGYTNKGIKHGRAKLNEKQVCEIRKLFGTKPKNQIAKEYGIAATTVFGIGTGLLWKHIPIDASL